MSTDVSRGKASSTQVLIAAAAALFLMFVILQLAGVPGAGPGGGNSVVPAAPHKLVSNNLKLGDDLHLVLHTVPQAGVWILASSETGPSWIGPYFTDLGADWFVLRDLTLLGGGSMLEHVVSVPMDPGLAGLEFAVQCAVADPQVADIRMSNSVHLKVSPFLATGKHVLLLRQTASTSAIGNPSAQATALAGSLTLLGNHVVVADDVLPAALTSYDVILDCRFTVPPSPLEAARFLQFLRQSGGVAFVVGPSVGSPAGQERALWVNNFLNTTLGISVVVATGGNLSASSVETVDTGADPNYLYSPISVAGLPFEVTSEGGNFGPPGFAAVGTPWISGQSQIGPMVFGMLFNPSDATAQTIGAPIGVLFAGGAGTLMATSQNPYPDLVFCNLVYYLDR